MVPWGLIAGVAATVIFPQHKGAILAATAVASILKKESSAESESLGGYTLEVGGNVEPVTLEWRDLNYSKSGKKGVEDRLLLNGVNGAAHPGRLLAIMGPSGSGKTTLLNCLAGQLPRSPHTHLTGQIFVNGVPQAQATHRKAYVRQEDIFYSQLTVRETLLMAASLQLATDLDTSEKAAYVDDLIQRLGLAACADTVVGDAKVRGISGGEKKRLSIACELMGSPSVLFADEPTTGLDAFQAEKVMATLRELAETGHTVLVSIHQPRSSIFAMFHDLLLLSAGSCVYFGPAQAPALDYFQSLGHECPIHVNPAEFFSDLISVDFSTPESGADSLKRVESLRVAQLQWEKGAKLTQPLVAGVAVANGDEAVDKSRGGRRGGWWTQFRLLLKRAWRQTTRDKSTNIVRGAVNVTSALIFGSIFWRMGRGQTSIQDRMGLLQVAAINTAMASLTKTLNVFPRERIIVDRERAKGSYAIGPYFASKLIAELPIGALFPLLFGSLVYPMTGLNPTLTRFVRFLGVVTLESFTSSAMGLTVGSMAPSTEAALALGPSMMTIFIVFGGYYVNTENTPAVFRWIPQVSLIRWAFEGLSLNEFRGLSFETLGPSDASTGDQVLERLSFGNSSLRRTCMKEAQILLAFYWATFYLLQQKKPRFQELLPPGATLTEVESSPDEFSNATKT